MYEEGRGERREKRKGTAGSMEEKGRVSVVHERRLEEENKAGGRRERDSLLRRRKKPTFPGGGRAYRRIGATFRFDLLGYIGANAWCHVNPKENTSSPFFFSGFRAPVQPVTLAIHPVFSTCILPWPIAGIVHAIAMCVCIYIVGRAGRICENKKGSAVENPSRDIEEILGPFEARSRFKYSL